MFSQLGGGHTNVGRVEFPKRDILVFKIVSFFHYFIYYKFSSHV